MEDITFYAYGHPAILCTHSTTLEITKEPIVTPRGNCIAAVRSSLGAWDLPEIFKETLASDAGRAKLTLEVENHKIVIEGSGSKGLTFTNRQDLVVRKSHFNSDRTLMVCSTKAALDIPRNLIPLLRDPARRITLKLSVWIISA